MEMLGRIRAALPEAAVTSDFIVGFCGETDGEFQATLDLVRTAGFKNSFIFKYSPRPGTKAHERLADDVPEPVKKERHRLLLDAQEEVSLAGNRRFVGTRQQVLVEGLSVRDEKRMGELDSAQTPQLTGRTMCDRIVVFDAPLRLVGRIVDVDVVSSAAWSLSGVVADGLADAVPLDGLRFGAEPQPLYQIATSLPGRPAGG
jgi:tRNA-2-methylthio-N6-dimethylallyladenosine synthase